MAIGPGYYDPDTGAWIMGEADLAAPGGMFSELINKITRSMTVFFTTAKAEAQAAQAAAEEAAQDAASYSEFTINDIGTNLSAPRKGTKPQSWRFTANAGLLPANIQDGDEYVRIDPLPVPFDFNQIPGYGGDYSALNVGGVANNASVNPWPDISGNNRPLVPASGTNVASLALFDDDAFGTSPKVPGVVFPSRSAMQYNTAAIGTPASVLICAGVRFRDVGTAATETLNTFGGQPNGRYSISRVGATGSQRLQIANADATAYLQSAVGDYTGELALIAHWTPNRQRLWCNGTLIIDHVETTAQAMPQMASFRIGIVATNSDTGLVKAMIDGRVNRFVWAAPGDVNYVTSQVITDATAKLNALMAA